MDLKRQVVKYTIKKGESIREVERPIKNIVLHFWAQLVATSKPGEYLFSDDLAPGSTAITSNTVQNMWRYWIKKKLGINCTLYSLKYLNTDELDSQYGPEVPAALNEHHPDMVRAIYSVGHERRSRDAKHSIIRNANNSFAPTQKENSQTKNPA